MGQYNNVERHDVQITDDGTPECSDWQHAWRAFALVIFATGGVVGVFIASNAGMTILLAVFAVVGTIAISECSPRAKARPSIEAATLERSAESIAEEDHRVTEFVELMDERNRIPDRMLH